jgi:hypothetical protein
MDYSQQEYPEEDRLPKNKKWGENSIGEKIFIISGYSIFFLSIICLFIAGEMKDKEIEENKGFTTGQITNYIAPAGLQTGWSIEYTYTVDGVTYENVHCGYRVNEERVCRLFMGRYFPVIYSTKNPKKSSILMRPDAFNAWGLAFPDSLKWSENLWGF